MNLLKDGIENESVQLTSQVVKLTVDGNYIKLPGIPCTFGQLVF
ncbi:hypothetical protein [Lachnobacterium bovis]|nr:hypothetical protein [Lachnobacterium bovis]